MAQYIDKSALVPELERRMDELYDLLPDANGIIDGSITISTEDACNTGKYVALESFKKYIDTLEVKEEYIENDFGSFWGDYIDSGGDMNNYEVAKHFFELGLNTQHSSINIPNIDDLFEEEDIDPNSKTAKIFKESYYMALERLKEKKGE